MEANFDFLNELKNTLNKGSSDSNLEKFNSYVTQKYTNKEMQEILNDESRFSLVIASAGSGKTTSLLLKLLKNKFYIPDQFSVPRERKVWVSTFLKKGAEDLKRRVVEISNDMQLQFAINEKYTFGTLHSEYYSILKHLGYNMKIITLSQQIEIFSKMKNYTIEKEGSKGAKVLDYKYKGLGFFLLDTDNISKLLGGISTYRTSLGRKTVDSRLCTQLGIEELEFENLVEDYVRLKKEQDLLDFDDLQLILYNLLCIQKKQDVIDFVQDRYDDVYLDEFQDVSKMQYEILKVQIELASRVFVIGDPDQSIYSWRGTDSKIISVNFVTDYKPRLLTLSTNYRCGSEILFPAMKLIQKNPQNRGNRYVRAYNKGGYTKVITTKDDFNMYHNIVKLVSQLDKNKTVAILSRTNAKLFPISILLHDELGAGAYSIEGGTRFTLDKKNWSSVIDVHKLVDGKLLLNKRTIEFLYLLLDYSDDIMKVDTKTDMLKRNYYLIKQKANLLYETLHNNNINLLDLTMDELDSLDIPKGLQILLDKVRNKDTYANKLRLLYYYLFEVSNKQEVNTQIQELIEVLLYLTLKNNIDSAKEFENLISIINQSLKENYKQNARVQLSTVHGYKGLQADIVIIVDVQDGNFPYYNNTAKQLTEDMLEEERRIFYIAATRARELEFLFRNNGTESMFLNEMDL